MIVLIKRSRWMLGYLLVSHFLALIAVFMTPMAWWLTALLFFAVLVSFVVLAQRFQWLASHSALKSLNINPDNHCYLTSAEQSSDGPYRMKRSVLFSGVIMLYLIRANGHDSTSIVIAKDAISSQDWRQLRVKLRDPDVWR